MSKSDRELREIQERAAARRAKVKEDGERQLAAAREAARQDLNQCVKVIKAAMDRNLSMVNRSFHDDIKRWRRENRRDNLPMTVATISWYPAQNAYCEELGKLLGPGFSVEFELVSPEPSGDFTVPNYHMLWIRWY